MNERTAKVQPFQFTLRHLLFLMAGCSIALAVIFHWGPPGFIVCCFLASVGAMLWGLAQRSHRWLEGGCWMLLAGLIIGCVVPPVQFMHTPSPRGQCGNHLKQIAIALHIYHDTYGSFPPTSPTPKANRFIVGAF